MLHSQFILLFWLNLIFTVLHFIFIIGCWACVARYGYVTPGDVSILLEQHIGKGEIVDRLWR